MIAHVLYDKDNPPSNLAMMHDSIDFTVKSDFHILAHRFSFASQMVLEYRTFVADCPTAWELLGE